MRPRVYTRGFDDTLMPDPCKIILRVHATTDDLGPADFVPVFHRLIQQQAIADHLLIDVADYAHVVNGPGTILVASEANIHIDRSDGRLGLTYVRKRPFADAATFEATLSAVVGAARAVAAKITADEAVAGRIGFDFVHPIIRLNDRLLAPNTAETAAAYAPRIAAAIGSPVAATSVASDELMTFGVLRPIENVGR